MMYIEYLEIDDLLESARRETDIAVLKSVIGQLLDLAHDHFQEEESVLFPIARQCLDEAALTDLGDEWTASRNVTIDG